MRLTSSLKIKGIKIPGSPNLISSFLCFKLDRVIFPLTAKIVALGKSYFFSSPPVPIIYPEKLLGIHCNIDPAKIISDFT